MPTEPNRMAPAAASTPEPPSNPARRVRRRYVLSLALLGVLFLTGTLGMHSLVGVLETDPPAINAAGRQRMLSQRLAKDALQFLHSTNAETREVCRVHLGETLTAWAVGHERLRQEIDAPNGPFSSDVLRTALPRVEHPYTALHEAGLALLAAYDRSAGGRIDLDAVQQAVESILAQEESYLVEMDYLVSLYQTTVLSRVRLLRNLARALALASVLSLVATGLFVLEPSVRLTSRQFRNAGRLMTATRDAERHLELRNKFIQDTFGRYVSDEVVHRLLDSDHGLDLGGEERKVTLLMADLRGFTALSASLPPQKTLWYLNQYLDCMSATIADHEGTVEEFIGDCIFATFGAPISGEHDARHAVACALSMQLALGHVDDIFRKEGLPAPRAGIAIHTDTVIAGNIGSARRARYGVVGPAVSFVSRLEKCALPGQVLISETTLDEVRDEVELGRNVVAEVKGFDEPIHAYELTGLKGTLAIDPVTEEPLSELSKKYPISYRRIVGDRLTDPRFGGEIVRVSLEEAEIASGEVDCCPRSRVAGSCPLLPIAVQDEVEVSLSPTAGRVSATTVYARVTDVLTGDTPTFRVRFTSASPPAREIINRMTTTHQASSGT